MLKADATAHDRLRLADRPPRGVRPHRLAKILALLLAWGLQVLVWGGCEREPWCDFRLYW